MHTRTDLTISTRQRRADIDIELARAADEVERQHVLRMQIGQWREFAAAAGVPYSTLEKVARGITKNPRYGTYEKIRQEWLRRTRRRPDDVDRDPT